MALRLMDASSSLWPPDRKVIPTQQGLKCSEVAVRKHLGFGSRFYNLTNGLRTMVVVHLPQVKRRIKLSPVTAGGTVRRSAVTVAMAISS